MRCVHEASLFEENCFITLTYDDEHVPVGGSLDKTAFQKFMKRLRKSVGGGVRFYHCGEYGETFGRPHYHAILFGHDFDDKVLHSEKNGNKVFTSGKLSKLWPFGFSLIGSVTFESAAYVARYIMKKINGDMAEDHYQGRQPEYTTMSRRPGIGKKWFDEFKSDVFPSDGVVVRGVECKPPRYYDNLLDKVDPLMYDCVKAERKKEGLRNSSDNDSFRLRVKEECVQSKLNLLVRPLEATK